jgi:hypothetical protein
LLCWLSGLFPFAAGGCSSRDGADPGSGIVICPVPEFSVPVTTQTGQLVPCDSISLPEPLGFLADGRPVVAQTFGREHVLVRSWDVASDDIETLFVARQGPFSPRHYLRVSDDGKTIVEIPESDPAGFRVYDVERRQLVSPQPIAIAVAAVSADGRFVLDGNLRRFTTDGAPDFDFAPLVPKDAAVPFNARKALSPAGDAIAFEWSGADSNDQPIMVIDRDGGVVRFSEAPHAGGSCIDPENCGLAFSPDRRHLLWFALGTLRVWETATARLVVRVDSGVKGAAFIGAGGRLLIGGDRDVVERDVDRGDLAVWEIEGGPGFVTGGGAVLGYDRGGLLVAAERQVTGTDTAVVIRGRWRQPVRSSPGAMAVSPDGVFANLNNWDEPPRQSPGGFWEPLQMVARFVTGKAGPAATLLTLEGQSQWDGHVLLSHDQRRVALVFPDSIRIADAASLSPLVTIGHGAAAIAWSPDDRYLASTPDLHERDPGRPLDVPSKHVTLWNTDSGALAARFATPVYPQQIAFSATGDRMIGWGLGGEVIVVPRPSPSGDVWTRFEGLEGRASFSIDLRTGLAVKTDAPPFIGSTRELIATEAGVFRVSTGQQLSSFVAPLPERLVFSGDFSVALGVTPEGVRLYAVHDGHQIAQGPSMSATDPLALSWDGRRVVVDEAVYCLAPD